MNNLSFSGVYKILNTVTHDFYIGSAKRLDARWKRHIQCLRTSTHPNIHLQRAWDKYGSKAFLFSVLEFVDDKTRLLEVEQAFFDKEVPTYNICKIAGNTYGRRHPQDILEKIAKSHIGMKASAETRMRMSMARMGHQTSAETREKIAASKRGKPRPAYVVEKMSAALKGKCFRFGFKHSEESKRKMSIAKLGNANRKGKKKNV
jgi:group I intron endonuclease